MATHSSHDRNGFCGQEPWISDFIVDYAVKYFLFIISRKWGLVKTRQHEIYWLRKKKYKQEHNLQHIHVKQALKSIVCYSGMCVDAIILGMYIPC